MEKSLFEVTQDDFLISPIWRAVDYLDDFPECLIEPFELKLFDADDMLIVLSKLILSDGTKYDGYVRYSFHKPITLGLAIDNASYLLGWVLRSNQNDKDIIAYSQQCKKRISDLIPIQFEHKVKMNISDSISSYNAEFDEDIGKIYSEIQINYVSLNYSKNGKEKESKRKVDLTPNNFYTFPIWVLDKNPDLPNQSFTPYNSDKLFMGDSYLIASDINFKDGSDWIGIIHYEPFKRVLHVGLAINENEFIWYSYSAKESEEVREKKSVEFTKEFGKKVEDVFPMTYVTKPQVIFAGITQ